MTESAVPVNGFEEAFEKEEIKKIRSADDEILAVYHMPGWKRIEELIDSLIQSRKADSEMREGELLETYGARRLASDEVIKDLETIKNNVKAIGKYADEQRKERGNSEAT